MASGSSVGAASTASVPAPAAAAVPPGQREADAPRPSSRRQTLRNIAWNYTSGLLSVFGLIVLYPLAVQAAGSNRYGLWVLCFNLIQLLVLADLGLGTGIVRTVAAARALGTADDARRAASVGITMFAALALALGLGFAVLLPLYLHTLHLTAATRSYVVPLVLISTVSLVLGVLGRGATSVLWGDNRYDIERKWAMGGLLVRAALIGTAAVLHAGILVVAVVEAVSIVLPGVACLGVAHRWHRLRIAPWSWLRADGGPLLRFSGQVFMGAFSAVLAAQLPLYVAAPSLRLTEVTAFGAWLRLYQGARMLFSWTANPFLAVGAAESAVEKRDIGRQSKLLVATGSIALLVSAPLLAAARPLVGAWLGAEFAPSATAFELVALGTVGMAISVPASVLASAYGRPGRVGAYNVVWAALTAVAVVAVRSQHSLTLVCLGIVVPLAALSPFYWLEGRRVSGLRLLRADALLLLRIAAVVAVASLALLAVVQGSESRIRLLAGLVSYAVCLLLGGAALFSRPLRSWWTERRTALA